MAFLRSSWRFVMALAALSILSLSIGCGGKKDPEPVTSNANVKVSGTVTYTRVPLLVDATTGVPLGLESNAANFKSMPLRGITLRAYQSKEETDANGNVITVWTRTAQTITDSSGKYTLSIPKDKATFVEVVSVLNPGTGAGVSVLATSISSSTPVADRPFFMLRKGVDGSAPPSVQTPGSMVTADATLDFSISISQAWWTGILSNLITESTSMVAGSPVKTYSPSLTQETVGTGSRVAGILDTGYAFGTIFGDPTPGAVLDLHFDPNSSDLRPSFVEYDRRVYPKAIEGNSLHFFGFIRSAPANDDAWDEGVLFSLFARNWLVARRASSLLPTSPLDDRSDLQDLRPDMAMLEGFVPSIAAVLLKSPYIADTSAGSLSIQDIRETTGRGADIYSAANISALSWELNRYASGSLAGTTVTPIPDTPTGWSTLSQTALKRFFTPTFPKDSNNNASDIPSLYSQLARMKETKTTDDSVDLAAFFPDATLTSLAAPFSVVWPRPTTTAPLPDPAIPEAGFLADWGANPNSLTASLRSFNLSMAKAHLNRLNQYPNFSKGEVFAARFSLNRDRIYNLSVEVPSGIPPGAQIEVVLEGTDIYKFESGTPPYRIPLLGYATTPLMHYVQIRLLSPNVAQPDRIVTVKLEAQN